MEAIKEWARSVYILAMLSSVVLLLVPRKMLRQVRFVAEIIMLLCILSPVLGAVLGAENLTIYSERFEPPESYSASLEKFYVGEIERRIKEIGNDAGIPVKSVRTNLSGFAPKFSVSSVSIYLSAPVEKDKTRKFRDLIAAYLGIDSSKITFYESSKTK